MSEDVPEKPLMQLTTDAQGNPTFVPLANTEDTVTILDDELFTPGISFVDSASLSLLEMSIKECRREVHPARPKSLIDLADALVNRFLKLIRRQDIDEAISLYCFALSLEHVGLGDRSSYLRSLGKAYREKFKHLGEYSDLDNSVDAYRQALRTTRADSREHNSVLWELAETLVDRYEELRQLDDLDSAISLLRMSAADGNAKDVLRPFRLVSLGSSLVSRYKLLRSPVDLDEAMEFYRQAKDTSSWMPQAQTGLAEALLEHADCVSLDAKAQVLAEAIDMLHDALLLTPPFGSSYRPTVLRHLANTYRALFSISGSKMDIDKSVQYARETIECLPRGVVRYSYDIEIAESLRLKFEAFPEPSLITEALSLSRGVISTVPIGHTDRSSYFEHLGRVLMTVYRHDQDIAALDNAFDAFRSAATLLTGPVGARFTAARSWAREADRHDHASALDAYKLAVDLLQELSLVGMELHNRYLQLLAHDTSLASDAAAYAIKISCYDEAIQFLESGRGILWSQSGRSPIHRLHSIAPALGKRFADISAQLERGSLTSNRVEQTEDSLGLAVERQRELSKAREAILLEIRRLPSFEDFLLPPTFVQLCTAASMGPVILVNASQSRRESLVILPNTEIVHVPLPSVDLHRLREVYKLSNGGRNRRHFQKGPVKPKKSTGDPIIESFSYLWHRVVEPVVLALGAAGYGQGTHVWWCGSGLFTGLPLHAAGVYPDGPNCMDALVSSYTPTLTALLRAREQTISEVAPRLLVIAQPDLPGYPKLPCVAEEINKICAILPSRSHTILEGPAATVKAVSEQLPRHSWLHIACHGSQDIEHPFESCFHLQIDSFLTIEAIMKIQQRSTDGPTADLAFLTACQTASSMAANPDESINLASGLQFAGFRSVIGTLWEIADEDGPTVTSNVYEYLFRDLQLRVPDSAEAAYALNRAVKLLRDSPVSPSRWAAFIHLGT